MLVVIVLIAIVLAWFGVELVPGYNSVYNRIKTWNLPLQCAFGLAIGIVIGSPVIVASRCHIFEPLWAFFALMLVFSLMGIYVLISKLIKGLKRCGG